MNRKRVLKYIAVAAVSVLLLGSLTSCMGASSINKPVATAESGQQIAYQEISGTISALQEGSTLKVTASSNLVNDTIYKISVDGYDGQTVNSQIFTKTDDESTSVEFAIDQNWPDIVYVSIVAQPTGNGKQTSDVYSVYGDKFELMSGENIIWNSEGNIFLVQSDAIEIDK